MAAVTVNARATVSTTRRLSTPLAMFVREYYRNVMNLVLLVVIPVLLVLSFGSALSRLADVLPDVTLTRDMGQSLGALWSAAFLTGLTGFFMMVGARAADRRLVRAGSRRQSVSLAEIRQGADHRRRRVCGSVHFPGC